MLGFMKRAAAWLLLLVMGCRFNLPEAHVDASIDGVQTDTPDSGGIDGTPVDSTPMARCPADYMPLSGGPAGHVYKKAPLNRLWLDQFDYCRSTSTFAYLAVPNGATELMGLNALAGQPAWVGINDLMIEGTFVEVETGGPATFLPWFAGNPDDDGPGQDCVMAGGSTAISDEDCNVSLAAVCECNP